MHIHLTLYLPLISLPRFYLGLLITSFPTNSQLLLAIYERPSEIS